MDGQTLVALAAAAFAAGWVDAIAGGGGLLTLPALMLTGVPVHVALGTNKGQSVFGSASALWTFWRSGRIDAMRVPGLLLPALGGSLVGAAAVRWVTPAVLRPLVLGLLVAAAVLVVVRPRLPQSDVPDRRSLVWRGALIALVLGTYDGFFGPGCGTFLLLSLAAWCKDSLASASAHAKVCNFASNLAAVLWFSAHDAILWPLAAPMVVGQVAGAAFGARMAMRGGDVLVRRVLLVVVVALVVKLGWDAAHATG